mmetsp:Transcript_48476/g.125767  ORF Transcript_48476/g.125767 Transcript_48476/m.125767 type:complete len:201 (-) Transcript_48476:352-954(-)
MLSHVRLTLSSTRCCIVLLLAVAGRELLPTSRKAPVTACLSQFGVRLTAALCTLLPVPRPPIPPGEGRALLEGEGEARLDLARADTACCCIVGLPLLPLPLPLLFALALAARVRWRSVPGLDCGRRRFQSCFDCIILLRSSSLSSSLGMSPTALAVDAKDFFRYSLFCFTFFEKGSSSSTSAKRWRPADGARMPCSAGRK